MSVQQLHYITIVEKKMTDNLVINSDSLTVSDEVLSI